MCLAGSLSGSCASGPRTAAHASRHCGRRWGCGLGLVCAWFMCRRPQRLGCADGTGLPAQCTRRHLIEAQPGYRIYLPLESPNAHNPDASSHHRCSACSFSWRLGPGTWTQPCASCSEPLRRRGQQRRRRRHRATSSDRCGARPWLGHWDVKAQLPKGPCHLALLPQLQLPHQRHFDLARSMTPTQKIQLPLGCDLQAGHPSTRRAHPPAAAAGAQAAR